ncbi:MFS transporter [Deinococcus peraridilitoris]|uniref:Arabinose efflux permease family protein n=1 Tax=Deinococcus peraridilitoris (strain DSM 19664 / LMG 22246 / CIP 109416 / KR-200) TaxID=937777 RepID=L0A2P7_DEIPD|nr:MFS transporter [Deinococcus peraridilitoris]AFZ67290.1 arabinose efflux permease family protein [Deinococcus peraridilitoris DSM 19664]
MRVATSVSTGAAVAVAVTAGHFINDAYSAMLSPLGPALRMQFGTSIAAITLLIAVFSFTSSVLQPFLGILGERFDRRLMAALGPAATGIGLSLMGYAPAFGLLVLLVAVAGLGSGLFHPAGAAFVARYSPVDQRGLWASLFSAGGTAGMALGPIFAGVGLHNLPVFAPIGLVVAFAIYLVTPAERASTQRPGVREYLTIFRGPMVTLWGMAVLRSLASSGFGVMLPFILSAKGYSYGATALALGVYSVASALGGIVGGRISDRRGRTLVLRSSILGTVPLFVLLVLSEPAQLWYYPLMFLVGAFINASIPVGVVTAQEYAPKHVAVASSIMMGFSWGFAGLLLFLVGLLADATTPTVATLVSISLLLPSVWLAYRLPEPQKARLD